MVNSIEVLRNKERDPYGIFNGNALFGTVFRIVFGRVGAQRIKIETFFEDDDEWALMRDTEMWITYVGFEGKL